MESNEHKRRIKKAPKCELEYQMLVRDSAIAEHALDTGHSIDVENVEIVSRGISCIAERLIAEAVEIAKEKDAVNKVDGVELSSIWRTALRRL